MHAQPNRPASFALALCAALCGLLLAGAPAEAQKLKKPKLQTVALLRASAEAPQARLRMQHAKGRGAKRAAVWVDGARQPVVACKRKACPRLVVWVRQKRNPTACYSVRVFTWQGKARVQAKTVKGPKVAKVRGRLCFQYPEQTEAVIDGATGKPQPAPPRPEPEYPRWIEQITLERPGMEWMVQVTVELSGTHADGVWFHYVEKTVDEWGEPKVLYPWVRMNPGEECAGQPRCRRHVGLFSLPATLFDAPCIELEAWAWRDTDGRVPIAGNKLYADEVDVFGGKMCFNASGVAKKSRG